MEGRDPAPGVYAAGGALGIREPDLQDLVEAAPVSATERAELRARLAKIFKEHEEETLQLQAERYLRAWRWLQKVRDRVHLLMDPGDEWPSEQDLLLASAVAPQDGREFRSSRPVPTDATFDALFDGFSQEVRQTAVTEATFKSALDPTQCDEVPNTYSGLRREALERRLRDVIARHEQTVKMAGLAYGGPVAESPS